jgi:TPR repeat protein
MKKKFIKLNIDDNHLSFGNLCRLIKTQAKNKSSAMQSEIFCTLFNVDSINDTTINNYCVGVRGINDDYKQTYINYQKKYINDKNILKDIIINLVSIIDGRLHDDKYDINQSESLKSLCLKLYNISKNDHDCKEEFTRELLSLINHNNLIEAMSTILFFVILDKKQPLYEEEVKVEIMENILSDTNISANDLKEYLNIKLAEEINFNMNLKKLANKGNAYACYELGLEEMNGLYEGYPRYNIALQYFKEAANSNHAGSYYVISKLYLQGLVGTNSKEDYEYAYKNATKAMELGSIAAINEIGLFYLNGYTPVKKDINKAIEYFEEAASKNYSYAYNNLGKIYEDRNDLDKAYEYYQKSYELDNSWAANKLGERERKLGNYKEAFKYYSDSINVPINNVCNYAYYNLAKYYYLNGNPYAYIDKDINKAIEYFENAAEFNILDAELELLNIYAHKYVKNKQEDVYFKLKRIVNLIENNKKYNNELKDKINKILKDIKDNKNIDLSIIK